VGTVEDAAVPTCRDQQNQHAKYLVPAGCAGHCAIARGVLSSGGRAKVGQ
jgi:hypothetical protein